MLGKDKKLVLDNSPWRVILTDAGLLWEEIRLVDVGTSILRGSFRGPKMTVFGDISRKTQQQQQQQPPSPCSLFLINLRLMTK